MTGFKPLLDINGKSLLEHAISLFKTTGIDKIITVIGHRSEELIPVLESASVSYVINDAYQDGMFSSIQCGIRELRKSAGAFFLLPVDIPFVHSSTIEKLLERFKRDSTTLVCYPQFQARRGHPPLIDCSLAEQVLTYDGRDGMRGFLRQYEDRSIVVPVDDPFIRMDMDTQEDLSRLIKELKKSNRL